MVSFDQSLSLCSPGHHSERCIYCLFWYFGETRTGYKNYAIQVPLKFWLACRRTRSYYDTTVRRRGSSWFRHWMNSVDFTQLTWARWSLHVQQNCWKSPANGHPLILNRQSISTMRTPEYSDSSTARINAVHLRLDASARPPYHSVLELVAFTSRRNVLSFLVSGCIFGVKLNWRTWCPTHLSAVLARPWLVSGHLYHA
jgi:hypothetical protein